VKYSAAAHFRLTVPRLFCGRRVSASESEFETIEGDDGDDGQGRYDPSEWNVALGEDADEHCEQYEQEEVEDVEDV